ncbi:HNH endonuclease [Listeria sp. FSL L7-1582]|uniref:HNH endonuclease n=1 Tax=Listeria portnoyi TaxID=2713504 RepID=UPI00164DEE05|nr:HNH endonuclease [Listeria portnoyi]MBC6310139.1 HNH endonuclease [Listeria portnoyi]
MAKPKKLCRHPSCRTLIEYDKAYCEQHQGIYNRGYNRARRQSDARYVSFYNSKAWRELREVALDRDYHLCVRCLANHDVTHAQLVDHIIPTKDNWELRLDLNNLQSLCESCHQLKTKKENASRYPH